MDYIVRSESLELFKQTFQVSKNQRSNDPDYIDFKPKNTFKIGIDKGISVGDNIIFNIDERTSQTYQDVNTTCLYQVFPFDSMQLIAEFYCYNPAFVNTEKS